MREAPGSPGRRAIDLVTTAAVGLLLVLFLGPGRGGTLAFLLLALLPLIVPRARADRRRAEIVLRGALALVLLAGFLAVLFLRSPAALLAAIVLLWVLPLAIGALLGAREEAGR